jgi:hypothetical protein
VKSDEEYNILTIILISILLNLMKINLNLEKYWFYNANLAQLLVQDFLGSYKYAYKWVALFYDNPNMIFLNPVFFKSHYLLESLFMLKYKSKFKKYLQN